MSYHIATFRLLNSEANISAEEEAEVQEVENRLGLVLPASVHEWFAYQNAIEILAEHSNQDPPIPLRDFATVGWQSYQLLPFRNENQGVCTWAIMLDGSKDPPVYVDVDSNGKLWQLLAPSFSAYVYSCVWDYRRVFRQPAFVQAQNCVLSHSALKGLTATCIEELQTHGWPGSTQYRFTNGKAAILIWSAEKQADWFIGSPDAATLETALRAVWNLDDVGKSLYDCSEIGMVVLEKLKRIT